VAIPRAVEKALDEEVSRFLKSGPTKEELGRIKTSSYASFVRDVERIDGSSGKAAILGESQLYGGSRDFYRTTLNWLRDAPPPMCAMPPVPGCRMACLS